MQLADDTRGRVPFALIGVLLLVGSTTYATTLSTTELTMDRDADVAMDRATAATETALRVAVTQAARNAARTPVAAPANNAWGDVLNTSTPFRDSLRVRIYVTAREGFHRVRYTHGDVTAGASLPPTPTPDTLRAAMDRVQIQGIENGTALRVTVQNVSVVARSDGRVVARETTNRTLTVPTPVLALHDRTRRFEESLDRGPLAGRGLGRRLTARLYPVVWARGYAQYGGLPIQNVLATRHVDAVANGAVLELQREAYGRPDPTANRAYSRALTRLAAEDVFAAYGTTATSLATSADSTDYLPAANDVEPRVPRLEPDESIGPDRPLTVGVNRSADRAFVTLLSGSRGRSLDEVLRGAYTVDFRLRTVADPIHEEPRPEPHSPGPEWTLLNASVSNETEVRPVDGPRPSRVDGWRRFRADSREVTVRHRVVWLWSGAGKKTSTSATWTETYAVGVAVDGRLSGDGGAPARPTTPLFTAGGALDGPNLAGVPGKTEPFLADRGGVDGVASRRVLDGQEALDRNGSVVGVRPDELDTWVYDDVTSLRKQVGNVTVTAAAGEVASGEVNPPARLAATIRDRRDELLAAPERYNGVSDRARVAVRAAYLDRVVARLDVRANATDDANRRLDDILFDHGVGSIDRARAIMGSRSPRETAPRPVGGPVGGPDVFVPQGGPSYLDVRGVDGTHVPGVAAGETVYPLSTRNLNVFTLPYGDAADTVIDATAGPETVRLHTAAWTLQEADRLARDDTPRVRARRDHLREEVAAALVPVRVRTTSVLARETTLAPSERTATVDAVMAQWNGTAARALAVTNGSFVPAVVEASGVQGRAADRLRVRLRTAIAEVRAAPSTRVDRAPVDSAASALRRVSKTALTEAIGASVNGTDDVAKRYDDRLAVVSAGVPFIPPPYTWYATVNVWHVEVRGEYPRFAVRTRRGSPGETITYVRDGSVATLDIDGDGDVEPLGHATAIDFSVQTVILVAVPPGRSGVGDVNGDADERSPGWGAETT